MNIEIKFFDNNLRKAYKVDYATNGAAAVDVRACINEPLQLLPGGSTLIPAGFAVHMEATDVAAVLLPRSGLAFKEGLVLGNTVGLIDSDYQQQIFVAALNRNLVKDIIIKPYDRIAQLMFIPVIKANLTEVDEFTNVNDRGGFGSTGKT